MLIHTIAFNKDVWTTTSARRWLRNHNEKPIKQVHETAHYYRYRIRPPAMFNSFITKKYPDHGINIILGR